MKKILFLILFIFLVAVAYLFNFSTKVYAYALCTSNGSWISCGSWSCPTSWTCTCNPPYARASGGSTCAKNSTHTNGVGGFSGHTCWFAAIAPFSASCGSYTAPTLKVTSTSCSSTYKSTAVFDWSNVSGAVNYRIGISINGGATTLYTTTASTYTATLPNAASISWYIETKNEVGWFGKTNGAGFTSKTCVVPACSYTYNPWGACSASGTQTRTVATSTPAGCTGTPDLSQPCTPPVVDCNSGATCGACNATTGTCGAGTKACSYQTSTTGASCNPVAAPSQTCTETCTSPQTCVSNQCVSPNCNSGEICGSCDPTTGTCGAGTKACSFTTFAGGGSCKEVPTANQSCSVGCTSPRTCVNNQCVAPAPPECNTGVVCGSCELSSGTCGTGSKTCKFTAFTGGGSCKQVPTLSESCSVGCSSTQNCINDYCVAKPPVRLCDPGKLADFAPAGVPTGGICMLNKIIATILNILIIAAIAFAVVFLIWGGIGWISSGGDKQKLQSSRLKIIFAIIGLVIVLASYLILNFINGFFGIS